MWCLVRNLVHLKVCRLQRHVRTHTYVTYAVKDVLTLAVYRNTVEFIQETDNSSVMYVVRDSRSHEVY